MITATNAAKPLINAISKAISPLTEHPSTSTGVGAVIKKRPGMMAGMIT